MTFVFQQQGAGLVLDDKYEVEKTILIDEPDNTNTHELNFIEDGKKVLVVKTRKEAASKEESLAIKYRYGNCRARYDGFEELDVETGQTVFAWNSYGYVSLMESTYTDKPATLECRDYWDFLWVSYFD
jgi:hypothetical protein